jgi:hypothetical protein
VVLPLSRSLICAAPSFSGLATRFGPRINASPGLQTLTLIVHCSSRRRVVSDAHAPHYTAITASLRLRPVPPGRQVFHLLRICPNLTGWSGLSLTRRISERCSSGAQSPICDTTAMTATPSPNIVQLE